MVRDGACETMRAVAVGIDNGIRADAAENLAVEFARRLRDDVRDAEFLAVGGRHHRRLHVAADRHDDDIAFAEAGFLEDMRLGGVALQGGRKLVGHLHGRTIAVQEEDLDVRVRERFRKGQAEAARADDSDSLHVSSILLASPTRVRE